MTPCAHHHAGCCACARLSDGRVLFSSMDMLHRVLPSMQPRFCGAYRRPSPQPTQAVVRFCSTRLEGAVRLRAALSCVAGCGSRACP